MTHEQAEARTVADWQQLKMIVADALDAPPERRPLMLETACAGDAALLREAEGLVAAADLADDTDAVLSPAADRFLGLRQDDPRGLAGRRVAQYELLDLIGEGAMSAVYRARQTSPDRDVAVKLLRAHTLAVDARRQFRQEVRALGRVRHENVAQIFEAGVERSADGGQLPYIAMELVDGRPLTEHADAADLDADGRAGLLATVADAVHAAHQRAVVHRDLKPANVLVTDDGVVKVLDFGIARITDADHRQTAATTAGLLLGTLAYMSPEQLSAGEDEIDVRTDVWALGVLLHELLTGRPLAEVKGLALPAAMRALESAGPDRRHPALAGDLGVIVGKACDRDPARRYASAADLAQDLRRWRSHEPIEARPPTRAYVLKKFARRNRGSIAAAALLGLTLLAGTAGSTLGYFNATQARADAEAALARASRERDTAVAVRRFLDQVLLAADPDQIGPDASIGDALGVAVESIGPLLDDRPAVAAQVRTTLAGVLQVQGDGPAAIDLAGQAVADARRSGDDATLFNALVARGTILERAREFTAAGEVAEQATALAKAHDERFEPVTRARLSNLLAGLHFGRSDFEAEARQYAISAELLDRARTLLTPREQVLAGLDSVAEVTDAEHAAALTRAGDWDEAERRLSELFDREVGREPVRPFTLVAVTLDLADVLERRGDFAASDEALGRAVSLASDGLPDGHDILLNAMQRRAVALSRTGEPEAAAELAGEVAVVMSRERPPGDIGLVEIQSTLTQLHYFNGDYARAATAAEQALRQARLNGEVPPHQLIDLETNLGAVRVMAGDEDRGFAAVSAAAERSRELHGPDSMEYNNRLSGLAMLYTQRERPSDAAPIYKRISDAMYRRGEAFYGRSNLWNHAWSLYKAGDPAAAVPLLERVLSEVPEGEDHDAERAEREPQLAEVRAALADG